MSAKITYRPSPTALLNPCVDPVFKRLFTDSSPEGKRALQCFLEAILQKPVSNIVIRQEELPIESIFDKKSKFDLNCQIGENEFANIEMQNYNRKEVYEKRAEYYCAHLLNHHVPEGLKWQDIPKVYQISVLNFIREKDYPNEIFFYKFRSDEGLLLEERQNIIFIELPKIQQIVKNLMDKTITVQSLTATQKWCIFILYASNAELSSIIQEIANSEEGIMCAVTVLKEISKDELEWRRQTDQLMMENDRISFLAYAEEEGLKRGMERGMEQGMKQGMKQGMEQGMKQGMEQGLKEGEIKKANEIAKKMIENNISLEMIKITTGLSDEEIKQLM